MHTILAAISSHRKVLSVHTGKFHSLPMNCGEPSHNKCNGHCSTEERISLCVLRKISQSGGFSKDEVYGESGRELHTTTCKEMEAGKIRHIWVTKIILSCSSRDCLVGTSTTEAVNQYEALLPRALSTVPRCYG